jgi:hypothetical protein
MHKAEMDGAMKSTPMKKEILYSAAITISILVFLEMACRIVELWVPPNNVDIGLGFTPQSVLFVEDKANRGLMRTDPVKNRAFHPDSFTMVKKERTCRIFALGGSSVNYLDSEFHLQEKRLETDLQGKYDDVDIINAGGLSYGSQRLVPIAAEIMKYDPDLVLLYSGHNEFEEIMQLRFASLETLWIQKMIAKSAFLRFVRDRIVDAVVVKLRSDHNNRILSRERPNWFKARKYQFTVRDVQDRMEYFRNNLSRIIELCKKNKVPIIIGTVPSNLVNPYLPKEALNGYKKVRDLIDSQCFQEAVLLGRSIIRNTPGRHQSSDSENEIIRSLARKYDCPLADVEKEVVRAEPHNFPGMKLFQDHCHLNSEGNKILIATYEPLVLQLLK